MTNIKQEKFFDQYFDTEDFALTKNDIWLRKRGEIFELKIPVFENEKGSKNQYQKIEGEQIIREVFAIAPMKSFEDDIADLGYGIFFEMKNFSKQTEFFLERKKVLEFLKTKKPDHYQALVEAGVVLK